jgi:group I intron endonuclease
MKETLWEEENLTDRNQNLTTNVENVNLNTTTETLNDSTKIGQKDTTINSGIYKIVNKINGKYYIGSTKNFILRWERDHKPSLRKGNHHNIHLQHAWDKYGEIAFEFLVLEKVSNDNLLIIEQKYLDVLKKDKESGKDTHYNISYIAGRIEHTDEVLERMKRYACNRTDIHKQNLKNSRLNLSELTKEKIKKATSESNKNRVWKEESKMKLSKLMKCLISSDKYKNFRDSRVGRIVSDETRKKLSLCSKGKTLSEETRRKISESNKKQIPWCKGKVLVKDDRVFTWMNIFDGIYESCTRNELRVKYNLGVKNKLLSVIRGERPHHKGWKIISDTSELFSNI